MTDGDGTPEGPSGDEDMFEEAESALQEIPEEVGRGILDALRGSDGPEGERSGGCLLFLAFFAVLGAIGILVLLVSLWNSDDPAQVAGPQTAVGLQFENTYNSEGQLIPIPGEWEIYNEAGVAGCDDDIELTAVNRRGELELMDPEGQRIRVRPPDSDWTEMELISSSDSEAVYTASITRSYDFTLTFTSSSTLGARLDGCADRGGQGWLEEPAR